MTDAKCEPPPELLPCPFCGGQASYTPTCHIDVVQCRVCGAQVMATMGQHEAAIVAWNRRVTPPATVAALVEALEGLMQGSVWKDAHTFIDGTPVGAGWQTIRMPTDETLSAARAALALYRGEAGR